MIKKPEVIFSIIAAILSFIAIYHSCNANRIAKENYNPFLKIEYLTVKGYYNFLNLWESNINLDSSFSQTQKKNIGIESILWKIETENIKI